jgi:hypothetical protein
MHVTNSKDIQIVVCEFTWQLPLKTKWGFLLKHSLNLTLVDIQIVLDTVIVKDSAYGSTYLSIKYNIIYFLRCLSEVNT